MDEVMDEVATRGESGLRAIAFHSIDYIPERERHGKVHDQFTLWFLVNAELATLAVGLIAISLRLNGSKDGSCVDH
jgi:NCS1 family nucleobase:cation symporter-1